MPRAVQFVMLALLAASTAACSNKSPTAPATTTPDTRVIELGGSLAFGSISVGSSLDRTLIIRNTGTSTLTVGSIQVSTPPGAADFAMDWTTGLIPAGASQNVTVRLTATAVKSYDGTLTVVANQTGGANTSAITGAGTAAPIPLKTTFEAGTYGVNVDIAAGRYFATPDFTCTWYRLSGLGGKVADIIVEDFVGDRVGQWIADIAPSDAYFKTNEACGRWTKDAPVRGLETTITAGMWLVGTQVAPGTYHANVAAGCYWERLSGFGSKGTEELIASNFANAAGTQTVEIKSTDVGFRTTSECGTWSP